MQATTTSKPRHPCRAVARAAGLVVTLAIAAGAVARPATAQDPAPVERIVAVVNGEVISLGQLARATRLTRETGEQATRFCTPSTDPSADLRARVLQCMIDDLLQFQYVRRFPQFDPPREAIDEAFSNLVAQYDSPAAFDEALRQQSRTAEEVRYDLEREMLIANYIQVRYRDLVEISDREIQSYYEDVLRPEMERQGAELPPLEAVDDELIAPLLRETEVNRRVDAWIADMRQRSRIVQYDW
jgi:hypothetical protein